MSIVQQIADDSVIGRRTQNIDYLVKALADDVEWTNQMRGDEKTHGKEALAKVWSEELAATSVADYEIVSVVDNGTSGEFVWKGTLTWLIDHPPVAKKGDASPMSGLVKITKIVDGKVAAGSQGFAT